MKYRKKPVVIEALKWDGTFFGTQVIMSRFVELKTAAMDYNIERNECTYWKIDTLEGGHIVSNGDYIIKGVKGEFYPCKPDIFEMTYERVEND